METPQSCLQLTQAGDTMELARTDAAAFPMKPSRLLSLVLEFDKVPDDIRSCLELVRVCHTNVQKLIVKRNEHIDLLTRHRPSDLAHVNHVIESALRSLQDVAALVEKSRPEMHSGKTNFAKRFWWTYSDKESFRKHLPLINHHHNAVSSELAYLRQLGSSSASDAKQSDPSFGRIEHNRTPQDMGLLIELLGGLSVPSEVCQVGISATSSTSIHTASITTTSSHSMPSSTAVHPPSYEQLTSGTGASGNFAAPFPSIQSKKPTQEPLIAVYTGDKAQSLGTERPGNTSIDESGLALLLSDYTPLPQSKTSVTIQKTIFNTPVNIVINVNGTNTGEDTTARLVEDTQAAVQAGLRNVIFCGGLVIGSPPIMASVTKESHLARIIDMGTVMQLLLDHRHLYPLRPLCTSQQSNPILDRYTVQNFMAMMHRKGVYSSCQQSQGGK
ncbi:hypothetical protein PG994_009521 [Apiospora phragmitis]|uniref:Uncharacterized protein n=1 Tax=Apiospora phragmitis TaxID=2905665 RepID=A0ABR1U938_9PEZI